jgi:hypothetical protein
MKDSSGNFLFTCPNCGGHYLMVVTSYRTATITQESMDCACSGGVAATRRMRRVDEWKEHFELHGDHTWTDRIGEAKQLESVTEQDEIEVICSRCFETGAWSGVTDDITEDPVEVVGTRKHWVRCMGCDREVRFVWSGPEDGRIWPVECSDFDSKT